MMYSISHSPGEKKKNLPGKSSRLLRSIAYWILRLTWNPIGAVILTYHSVGDNGVFFSVSVKDFARQMRYLAEHKFNVVSLDTLAKYRSKGIIPPKTVAITFDDGFRDNMLEAIPILRAYGFPATLFLSTGLIGIVQNIGNIRLPMLSRSDLSALQAYGVTLGAHTVNHPKLTMVEDACARQEIEDSKKAIESLTGVDCRHFAYPHGRYNSVVIEAVRNAGFPYAYTTDEGLATSRSRDLMIPRNGIDSAVSFFDFKSIVRIGRISRKRLKHHIL